MQTENPEERAGPAPSPGSRGRPVGARADLDPSPDTPLSAAPPAAAAGEPGGRWKLLVFLGALAVLLGSFFCQWRANAPLIRETVLRGEEGPVEGRSWTVRPGVRLRLELTLSRPASLVVFLQDSRGGFSEVYPIQGDAPVLRGPRLRLPENDSWDTAGLESGGHCLWILAGTAPVAQPARAAAKAVLEANVEKSSRGGFQGLLDELGQALQAERVDVERRPFLLPRP